MATRDHQRNSDSSTETCAADVVSAPGAPHAKYREEVAHPFAPRPASAADNPQTLQPRSYCDRTSPALEPSDGLSDGSSSRRPQRGVSFGAARDGFPTTTTPHARDVGRHSPLPTEGAQKTHITVSSAEASELDETLSATAHDDAETSLNGSSSAGGGTKVSSTGGTSSTFELCGRRVKVPFTVWTFLAMSVPILMLVISTAMPMAASARDVAVIDRFTSLAEDVASCVAAVNDEDEASHWRLYVPIANASAIRDVDAAMAAARLSTQHLCDDVVLRTLRRVAQGHGEFDQRRDAMQAAVRRTKVARYRFDLEASIAARANRSAANRTDGQIRAMRGLRAALQASAARATDSLARVLELVESADGRRFVDLKLVATARSSLSRAAAVGVTLMLAGDTVQVEEVNGFIRSMTRANADMNAAVGSIGRWATARLNPWRVAPTTQAFFAALHNLTGAATRDPGAALEEEAYARDPALAGSDEVLTTSLGLDDVISVDTVRSRHFTLADSKRLLQLADAALAGLQGIEHAIVDDIAAARASHSRLGRNAAMLVVGIGLSIVAATLLAREQLKVQGVLQQQMQRIERTKRAVAAFVPRFFLNKMGYTSITQVCVGDSAEVALTMLFADIRHFTTVAEGMTSRALFDWVQGYFRLMTTIIDGHHGNINQFIGDALFALFSTARDGVACSIAMQAKAQQLNLERLCVEGVSVPLNIGIGLHHDVLSLGILGDDKRHTCTAISASVNLASRLEGLTKQLGCRILASDAVVDQLGPTARDQVKMRRVGPVVVKGSGEPVVVHDVFQADARELQQLKQETKPLFEAFSAGVLELVPPRSDLPAPERLRVELESAAARIGTEDRSVSALEQHARPELGAYVFVDK